MWKWGKVCDGRKFFTTEIGGKIESAEMKKKSDWPIECCEMCKYLSKTPIDDAVCDKTDKYLWLNSGRDLDGKGFSSYKYMPEWCPLENFSLPELAEN
jgi:hypothetical protein